MTVRLARARHLLFARPWLSAGIAVLLVGGGVVAYTLTGRSGGGAAASATTTTRLVSATTGTVRESVSTTGTLAPADQEDVSFSSSAKITSVRVAQGDKVTKGEVLGTIDTLSLKATLAQTRATLANAKATLASAEDASSTTSAQLGADKASVTTAKAAVTAAQDAIDDATLRSPITGTIAAVNVSTGGTAAGSGTSSSGTSSSGTSSSGIGTSGTGTSGSASSGGSGGGTGSGTAGAAGSGTTTGTSTTTTSSSSSGDFVVVGMKKWAVSVSVDDTEIGLLAKGDQAQITTDNVTGTIFGIVSAVSVLSASTSGSASYPVTVTVTGLPAGLHDGASATVAIVYKQVTNVVTVPTAAIHRESNTSSYVYVSTDDKKAKTAVKTGLTASGTTQITSGLRSGQQVFVETVVRRSSLSNTGNTQNRNSGNFPGGGSGYFPVGGSGNFPGGGAQGGGNR